jgi:hypothetical protein
MLKTTPPESEKRIAMTKIDWRKAKSLRIEKRAKLKQHPNEKRADAIKRNKRKNEKALAEYEQQRVNFLKHRAC